MITREFLASLPFRPFQKTDYYGFSGVESPVPLIAETDEFLAIIDGQYCEVYTTADLEAGTEPTYQVEDIRLL